MQHQTISLPGDFYQKIKLQKLPDGLTSKLSQKIRKKPLAIGDSIKKFIMRTQTVNTKAFPGTLSKSQQTKAIKIQKIYGFIVVMSNLKTPFHIKKEYSDEYNMIKLEQPTQKSQQQKKDYQLYDPLFDPKHVGIFGISYDTRAIEIFFYPKNDSPSRIRFILKDDNRINPYSLLHVNDNWGDAPLLLSSFHADWILKDHTNDESINRIYKKIREYAPPPRQP